MRYHNKKIIGIILIIAGSVLLCPVHLKAQNNLENNIREILNDPTKGGDYLRGYTQPLATGFGIHMGGALFHRANVKSIPHSDIGLSFVYLNLPEKAKTFTWNDNSVPTVFGKTDNSDSAAVQGTGLSILTIPQLQINIGLFGDFELMVRGWPSVKISEIGEITIYGVGVKYGLSDLVSSEAFPINLSVQASYHALNISEWVNVGTFGMNIQVSKDLVILPLALYGGVGYEATSMTINTTDVPDIGDHAIGDVRLNGENGLRINFGVSFTLMILTLHLDYNINEYDSFAGGIKIVF